MHPVSCGLNVDRLNVRIKAGVGWNDEDGAHRDAARNRIAYVTTPLRATGARRISRHLDDASLTRLGAGQLAIEGDDRKVSAREEE